MLKKSKYDDISSSDSGSELIIEATTKRNKFESSSDSDVNLQSDLTMMV